MSPATSVPRGTGRRNELWPPKESVASRRLGGVFGDVHVGLNHTWMLTAAIVPLIVGLIVAWPLWRRRVSDDMGSVLAAGVILVLISALVVREYGEVELITQQCRLKEIPCHFRPQPFVRYVLISAIGMCQVFVVFVTGLRFEERLRRNELSRQTPTGG